MDRRLQDLLSTSGAFNCLNCGKCTAACPLPAAGSDYSPRRTVARAIRDEGPGAGESNGGYWPCLTCKACEAVCPMEVDYTGFVRSNRQAARSGGDSGRCTHAGIFQSVPRLQSGDRGKPDRLGWIPRDAKVAERGEWVLFVGCLPFYDVVFSKLGVSSTASAAGAIRLLNHLGIEPAVLSGETCCGHDAYWSGETETFRSLAERNVEVIREAGGKTVLTTCAECYLALSRLYPAALGSLPFEVRHFYDFLLERKEQLGFHGSPSAVTFHDPCRLAKHLGMHDAPRRLMALAGKQLREMPRNRLNATCCGVSGWSNCGLTSRRMQRDRLKEATGTGASTLVTACPKCLIHLSCAKKIEGLGIEIQDLTHLLANACVTAGEAGPTGGDISQDFAGSRHV
ncbi:MAG: (Fe-S)-binding protein [Planctomycetes bacterium]|nr:(Fe-S)-binding protein [Planctomycetota bacterium]